VEREFDEIKGGALALPDDEIARIRAYFAPPAYELLSEDDADYLAARRTDREFDTWCRINVKPHKQPGYAIADISLKPSGGIPGDATADQMDIMAELAMRYSFDELRITYKQNVVLPHVRQADLLAVWQELDAAGLATANVELASDIIACPGLDYCNLANARSIPVAQRISTALTNSGRLEEIGPLRLNISGCINACGHHHAAEIGLLGVDRKGKEFYQITLGGNPEDNAAIGQVIGPSFSYEAVTGAVETVLDTYLAIRQDGERFGETWGRVGPGPFKEALYGTA
jgi:sulfite reductase (NADPH) hemoprotein beta-component